MRLIDADKLELKHYAQGGNAIVGYAGTIPLYHYVDVIKEDINNAPTVEAIPIEWVKRWIEDNRANHQVIWMLDAYLHPEMDWRQEEKENEAN